jgi:hypothetical protein
MEGKIIIVLIFVFSATVSQAQKNKFIPPDWKQKTHSFALPELRIDSTFIANLDTVLFDKNCRIPLVHYPKRNSSRHFHIRFEKTDSLNYSVVASLWDIPANSNGFFEHYGYFYWFGGEVPPNIILETKSKRRFSYKEHLPMTIDPPFWYLTYNIQTGSIEVKGKNFY